MNGAIKHWGEKINDLVNNSKQLHKYCSYLLKYLKHNVEQSNSDLLTLLYIADWWDIVAYNKYFDGKDKLFMDVDVELKSILKEIKKQTKYNN